MKRLLDGSLVYVYKLLVFGLSLPDGLVCLKAATCCVFALIFFLQFFPFFCLPQILFPSYLKFFLARVSRRKSADLLNLLY